MDSKSLSHTKWKGRYHIVLIPKYRKKKLFGQLKPDVREIPEDAIKKYIREQSEESRREESGGAAF